MLPSHVSCTLSRLLYPLSSTLPPTRTLTLTRALTRTLTLTLTLMLPLPLQLLERGADTSLQDVNGQTAKALAQKKGNAELLKLFEEFGKESKGKSKSS